MAFLSFVLALLSVALISIRRFDSSFRRFSVSFRHFGVSFRHFSSSICRFDDSFRASPFSGVLLTWGTKTTLYYIKLLKRVKSNTIVIGGIIMIKTAICDDIPQMADAVEELLIQYNQKLFESNVFYYPEKLIRHMKKTEFDLFILDIEFPNTTGIDLAEIIRQNNLNVPIIFLTNYKEYMEDVFKVQTFDYIIKPVTKENLFPVLDRVMRYLDVREERFIFSYNKISYSLKINDLVYFEKNRRQVIIHSLNEDYVSNMSTTTILSKLNDCFVQVHTSFIVNVKYIKEIGNNFLILKKDNNSIEIPMSRKYKETARDKILMKLRDIV
ncbi:LytR/AlgR family response regulator transcription factor [Lysinibacillus sp. TE18511]